MKTVGSYNHNFTFPISFLFFFLFSTSAFAQSKTYTYQSVGISHIQFQEDLNLEKNISLDKDYASLRGTVIQFQKQTSVQGLGFSMGAIAGLGRAVAAGSGGTLSYSGGAQWFLLGVTPKIYYRLTKPISFGVQGLAFYKSTKWADYNGITATSKHNFNFAVLGDLTMQLTDYIEFVQSAGSINGDATLWKIGLNYLF
ncbi:hypothetical protein CIK05_15480 [Bdellovibrio sp. qaytius]|nr:hypothetical protein CIK05_15480 [Bdellovibrio sp. qaytius]